MNKLMLDLYQVPLTPEEATITLKEKSHRLKQWIPEHERPAGKPKPARRRQGRSRRVV
jgi:hypothetical protein